MVSLTIIFAALTLVPSAITIPSGLGQFDFNSVHKSLDTRQGSPWQWWTEGQGQFSCQQQGGGKYTCSWNGKSGGGMVAGTGCKYTLCLRVTNPAHLRVVAYAYSQDWVVLSLLIYTPNLLSSIH
jgi:hypothetical protein